MNPLYLLPLIALGVVGIGAIAIFVFNAGGGDDKPTQNKPAREPRAERERLPYRYGDDIIFVWGRSVWTGFFITTTTDEHITSDDLVPEALKLPNLLHQVAREFHRPQFQVMLVPRRPDLRGWTLDLLERAWKPTDNYRKLIRRESGRAITQDRLGAQYDVVFLMRIGQLGDSRGGGSAAVAAIADQATGVHDEYFDPAVIAEWHERADEVYAVAVDSGIGVQPMLRRDLVRIIRTCLFGHLPIPDEQAIDRRPWGAHEFELAADFRAPNHKSRLEVNVIDDDTGEDQKTYLTTLVATGWPDAIRFAKSRAWGRILKRLDFPVVVSWRGILLPPEELRDRGKKIRDNLEDEARDMDRASARIDSLLVEQVERANHLVDEQDSRPFPGMESQLLLGLSAPTPEELENRRKRIERLFAKALDATILRPKRLQYRLLYNVLPGDGDKSPIGRIAPFRRLQELDQLGVALLTTATQVGDRAVVGRDGIAKGWQGILVGRTRDGHYPVHYSAHSAIARENGAGVVIVGASGGGKTTLALKMFHYESEAGVRCVFIDPKIDAARMAYYLAFGSQVLDSEFMRHAADGCLGEAGCPFQPINEAYWRDTEIIDPLRGRAGNLDPLLTSATVTEGRMHAQAMLEIFLGEVAWSRISGYVVEAFSVMVNEYDREVAAFRSAHPEATREDVERNVPRPTTWNVLQMVVDEFERVRDAGVADTEVRDLRFAAAVLEDLRKNPYARVAFARESTVAVDDSGKRRTIITLRGLPRAHGNSSSANIARGIIYLVTRLGFQMLEETTERDTAKGWRPQMLFVDEAYSVASTGEGRDLISFVLKQGRAFNIGVVLITQQAGDLARIESEDVDAKAAGTNQIHTVFAFRHHSDADTAQTLPLLNRLTDDRPMIETLKSLRDGECVMRDVDSELASVEVDRAFFEFAAAIQSNPHLEARFKAIDPSADVDDWRIVEEASTLVDGVSATTTPTPTSPATDDDFAQDDVRADEGISV
ncbi:ATP-binding protein [Actinopolymorpha alba]|uniref:ATP-binding protein n=1 Tax=Actinopolymorpha alba TaxID=533267 RepID=UPI00037794F8|nr:ATP-binding protein [Actinopolymorpha alba]